jgi:hypothetical protein
MSDIVDLEYKLSTDVKLKRYVDYSNTIIYQLCCKDETVTDTYIGHTTNFKRRIEEHCKDSKIRELKLYVCIRAHGGWDNWNMNILGTYSCKNLGHASRIEWYWFNKLGGTLNSLRPGMNYISRDMRRNNLKSTTYIDYLEYVCRHKFEEEVFSFQKPDNYPRNLPVLS